MKFDGKFMVVMDLYPSPVVIDRLPIEDEFGRLVKPPHRRGPRAAIHASMLADVFALSLVPVPGEEIGSEQIIEVMEKRMNDFVSPLHQMAEIQLSSVESEKET